MQYLTYQYNIKLSQEQKIVLETVREVQRSSKVTIGMSYSEYKAEVSEYISNNKETLSIIQKNLFSDLLEQGLKDYFKSQYKARYRIDKNFIINISLKSEIDFKSGQITLGILGKIPFVYRREIPEEARLLSAYLTSTDESEWKIKIIIKRLYPKKKKEVSKVIGLDFSLKYFYVASNNQKPLGMWDFYKHEARIIRETLLLEAKEYKSNNYVKQKYRLDKAYRRLSNARLDFLHKESTRLSLMYDLVVIEDLNLHEMATKEDYGIKVHNRAWAKFVNLLEYKMMQQGKTLVKVSKWFPSSRICSNCGKKQGPLRVEKRLFSCDCGFCIDRDLNAAINIRNEGVRLFQERVGAAR